jgi:PhzF family phenazine biosynthesis protein
MPIPIYQVDAFTNRPFGGNPAAVCLLPEPREESWMQNVAREMNLSETAFLHREGDCFRLRWFTPKVEVALCGHATLASAHVLWETGQIAQDAAAHFQTLSGWLCAERKAGKIELNFPAKPVVPAEAPPGLAEALKTTPVFTGRSQFDYLVEVESPETLCHLQPDFAQLTQLPVRGVIVTSRSNRAGFDFMSRFFAPASGVNEDPVTGSAHCSLGPYWQSRLGQSDFVAWQASARGGEVQVKVRGDRVLLGGEAVTVLRGELV